MRNKLLLVLTVMLILVLPALSMTACANNEVYSNIYAEDNVYSTGTQTVTITANNMNLDAPTVKFKSTISASDIELGDALVGKKVTKVTYNGETSITVVLDGDTKAITGEKAYGTITVKHSGLESKGSSSCILSVYPPEIVVTGMNRTNSTKGDVTLYGVYSKLSLAVGEFTDNATAENITLVDGSTGDVTVSLENGVLSVTVKNCNVYDPTICLNASTTTFGKEIKIKLTAGNSTYIR